MDFNPILIEDDGVAIRQNGSLVENGDDEHRGYPRTATSGNAATAGGVAGGRSGQSSSSLGITSSSSFGDALRACRSAFFCQPRWGVPFPELPAVPYLYYPDEYRELVESTVPVGVMQSELDAMRVGLLESIPLAYYPLHPTALEEARQAAQRVAAAKKKASGAVNRDGAAWRSSSSTPSSSSSSSRLIARGQLDPGDARIADIVVDRNEIQIRNLPSLTHVQRPLYTDIGLVPQEQRHAARVARLQPPVVEARPDAALATAEARKAWQEAMESSFEEAAQVDAGFYHFMGDVAETKLGLDRANAAHLRIARSIWKCLFGQVPKSQQAKVWHAICHFSSTYGDLPTAQVVASLSSSLEALCLPHFSSTWQPLMKEFTDAVESYTRVLVGGFEQRRSSLLLTDKELDQRYVGNVNTNIDVAGTLHRTSGDRKRSAIYPVEVIPVYPSGYEKAVSMAPAAMLMSDAVNLDFLAEREASLHQVVLPDALISKKAATGPNLLVGGCNLLVAEEGTIGDLRPGATLSYKVMNENTYKPLLTDSTNSASYLLRLIDGSAARVSASIGSNSDGRCVVYDRIGHRDIYQKKNNTDSSTLSRYVLLFSSEKQGSEEPPAEEPPQVRVKRERDGVDGGTAAVAAPRLRLE